jgi:hypothetical protein
LFKKPKEPETNFVESSESNVRERYQVYYDDEFGRHEYGVEKNSPELIPGGYEYNVESLDFTFNGKFSTKTKKMNGRLDLTEHQGWRIYSLEDAQYEHGINGSGLFGTYNFNFHG